MRVWPGGPYPLGATWDSKGVNFALFSEQATMAVLLAAEARRVQGRSGAGVSLLVRTPQGEQAIDGSDIL